MKLSQKIFVNGAMLAICMSMLGCSGGADEAAKEIAAGQFVLDEPIQITQGSLKESSKCFMDAINGKGLSSKKTWEIHRGEEAVISGWAFSKDGSQAAPQLFISLTGAGQSYYAVTTSRYPRNDVNQYFHLDASLNVGYELRAKTDQIEPGTYAITTIQAYAPDIESCESPAMLIVN